MRTQSRVRRPEAGVMSTWSVNLWLVQGEMWLVNILILISDWSLLRYRELSHGSVTYSGSQSVVNGVSWRSVAVFSCNPGFKLHGAVNTTCLEDGSWSSVGLPQCQSKNYFIQKYFITLSAQECGVQQLSLHRTPSWWGWADSTEILSGLLVNKDSECLVSKSCSVLTPVSGTILLHHVTVRKYFTQYSYKTIWSEIWCDTPPLRNGLLIPGTVQTHYPHR